MCVCVDLLLLQEHGWGTYEVGGGRREGCGCVGGRGRAPRPEEPVGHLGAPRGERAREGLRARVHLARDGEEGDREAVCARIYPLDKVVGAIVSETVTWYACGFALDG